MTNLTISTTVAQEVTSPALEARAGQITATSLQVAEHFQKRHTNVIRAIRNLEVPDEFNRLNFEPVAYVDEKGERRPMYHITRDGFALLAMGFTGKEAMRWKLAYITTFNAMEAKLRALFVTPLLSQNEFRNGIKLQPVERPAPLAYRDLCEGGPHLGREPVAVHAQVCRGLACADEARFSHRSTLCAWESQGRQLSSAQN